MKKLNKKMTLITIVLLMSSNVANVLSYCTDGDCAYTDINCAECCKAGAFISPACARNCNCTFYNDTAWATQKNFPYQ